MQPDRITSPGFYAVMLHLATILFADSTRATPSEPYGVNIPLRLQRKKPIPKYVSFVDLESKNCDLIQVENQYLLQFFH